MRFYKLARSQFLVEGRWIISHGISEGVNLLVKQDPQLLNNDFFHVASLNLVMPKRRFPDIHHNDSYAHRPYMSSCTRHKRRKAVTTSESPTAEKTATGGYGHSKPTTTSRSPTADYLPADLYQFRDFDGLGVHSTPIAA